MLVLLNGSAQLLLRFVVKRNYFSKLFDDGVVLSFGKILGRPANTISNGIDLKIFHPPLPDDNGAATRQKWNLPPDVPILLHVGRLAPNKRIEDVIRYFHAYQRHFNPRTRLLLVGSYGGFEKYLANLHQLCARLGVTNVHFTGHVSDAELTAYYEVGDLFLCASAHEGFCVPIVESFYMEVPVLAYAATAVPATMDGAGVLYDIKDPLHVAALMDAIVSNCPMQEAIVRGQLDAVRCLQAKDFAGTLLGFVDEILGSPRAPMPRVAFDFWQQFDAAEELEELRLYRPAIYKALPAEP
jgi:glycosyltransferase involved in cell wall biosynthesis